MTAFGMVTQVREKYIFRRSDTPTSQRGGAPAIPQNFWDPYILRNGLTYTAMKFGTVTHLGEQRVFKGSAMHAPSQGGGPQLPQNFRDP